MIIKTNDSPGDLTKNIWAKTKTLDEVCDIDYAVCSCLCFAAPGYNVHLVYRKKPVNLFSKLNKVFCFQVFVVCASLCWILCSGVSYHAPAKILSHFYMMTFSRQLCLCNGISDFVAVYYKHPRVHNVVCSII